MGVKWLARGRSPKPLRFVVSVMKPASESHERHNDMISKISLIRAKSVAVVAVSQLQWPLQRR